MSHEASSAAAMPVPREQRLRVWIIYQGPASRPYVAALRQRFSHETIKDIADCHTSGDNADNAEDFVYGRIIHDLDKSDVAVALITPDNRPASQAGNVWLEIGLWLAKRSARNLLICLEESAADNGLVELTSDLRGKVAPRFSSADQLWIAIQSFVDEAWRRFFGQQDRAGGPGYPPRRKVYDTLDPPQPVWLDESSYSCHDANGPDGICTFREAALEFSAELLRMGRLTHERCALADVLHHIGRLAGAIVFDEDAPWPENISRDDVRKDKIWDLKAYLGRLDEFAADLDGVRRQHYAARPQGPDFELWNEQERLARFIEDRVEAAARPEIGLEWMGVTRCRGVRGWASDFVAWGRSFPAQCDKCEFVLRGKGHNEETRELVVRLKKWAEYCSIVAVAFRALERASFSSCRHAMKTAIQRVPHPERAHEFLKTAVDDLPHNSQTSWSLRNWPRYAPRVD